MRSQSRAQVAKASLPVGVTLILQQNIAVHAWGIVRNWHSLRSLTPGARAPSGGNLDHTWELPLIAVAAAVSRNRSARGIAPRLSRHLSDKATVV
jgi:hypothetical protein